MELGKDPVINSIYNGIKKDIKVALDNECYTAALILIFAGIDAMANLSRPENQTDVKQEDFVRWVNSYIKIDGCKRITGEDLYSSRCAVIHTYGVDSRRTRDGSAKRLIYKVGGYPSVDYNPSVSNNLLCLDILVLADAFFKGIDKFVVNMFADTQKKDIFEDRLKKILRIISYDDLTKSVGKNKI